MRDYGKVSPRFWTGGTGKSLRGEMEAQVVALYLMTSPHANMIGVYHLPMLYLAHETGLSLEGASKGLQRCIDSGFCTYDADAETVFVTEMAAHQVGEELKPNDNRTKSIQKQYEGIAEQALKAAFLARYGSAFGLESAPKGKGLGRGSKAPTKPETETGAETGEGSKPPKGRKTHLPDGFAISERVAAWAKEKGHTQLPARLEHFVGAAKARGYTYVDWDEAFMTAVRDDWAKLGKPSTTTRPGGGRREL